MTRRKKHHFLPWSLGGQAASETEGDLSNSQQLQAGLASLPQELYDKIYDLVFDPALDGGIARQYFPPVQMHICRRIRAAWIQSY